MVVQMTRSALRNTSAKASGEGQAVVQGPFSAAMAASRVGISSSAVSQNSFSPTRRQRGTASKSATGLVIWPVTRSLELSLTNFHLM